MDKDMRMPVTKVLTGFGDFCLAPERMDDILYEIVPKEETGFPADVLRGIIRAGYNDAINTARDRSLDIPRFSEVINKLDESFKSGNFRESMLSRGSEIDPDIKYLEVIAGLGMEIIELSIKMEEVANRTRKRSRHTGSAKIVPVVMGPNGPEQGNPVDLPDDLADAIRQTIENYQGDDGEGFDPEALMGGNPDSSGEDQKEGRRKKRTSDTLYT